MQSPDEIITSDTDQRDTCQPTDSCDGVEPDQSSDVMSTLTHLWAPCSCLLMLTSIQLIFTMFRGTKNSSQCGSKTLLKVFVSIAMAVLSLVETSYSKESPIIFKLYQGTSLACVIQAGVFGILASLALEESRNGPSWLSLTLSGIWCSILASAASVLSSYPLAELYSTNFNPEFLIDLTQFTAALLAFILSLLPERSQTQTPPPESEDVHPEDGASWWSNLTLSWIIPLLRTGFKQNLEETDIPRLASKDKCVNVVPRLEHAWRQEEFRCQLANERQEQLVDEQQNGKLISEKSEKTGTTTKDTSNEGMRTTRSLFKALIKAYGFRFFSWQIIKTVFEMHDIGTTLLTAALMNHIQNRQNESGWYGVGILICMFLFRCTTELFHHRSWFTISRLTRHMKICTIIIIFKKAITVKNECMKDKTNGELVNLISEDCDRVFHMGQHIFLILMTPLKIGIALYLLYSYLGSSMLVGVILMVLLIPLNSYVGKKLEKLNKQTNDSKDNRVKLMNDIVNGIKVHKLYAWEKSFIDKINIIRSDEVDSRVKKSTLHACIDSMFRAIPFLVKSGAFGTFLLLGGHLDATKAFTTISLFHTLNHPLSLMALLMPVYMEAVESLKRINKFLNGEDISSDVLRKTSKGTTAVSIKDGEFSWEKSSQNPR